MRGVSTDTDSNHGDVELGFAESIAASSSSTTEEDLQLHAERPKPGGANAVVSGATTDESETGCASGEKAPAGVSGGPSAFGIAYKANRLSSSLQRGYDLPSGPAFADEDEFEQEMGAEFRVARELYTGDGTVAGASEMAGIDDFSEGRCLAGGETDAAKRRLKQNVISRSTSVDHQVRVGALSSPPKMRRI